MKKLILIITMALACSLASAQTNGGETLYIIDGVISTKAAADELPGDMIRNMNVVKGVESVVVITTKIGREISGRVVDTEGSPMPGVQVIVPMTDRGVMTGMDGTFKIILPAGEAFLKFSFIDYPTKTVQVDRADMGDVVLDRNAQQNVIVVKDVTGKTTIKGERLFLVKKANGEIYKIDSFDSIPAGATKTMHVFKGKEAELFNKYGDTSNGVILVELN